MLTEKTCTNPECQHKEDLLNFMLTSKLLVEKGAISGKYFLMSLHGETCQANDYETPEEAIKAYRSGEDTGK